MSVRILVTGAAGRLGRVVAARFHERGHDVLATDVVDHPNTPYRFEQADLLDHERTLELLADIDVVAHIGNLPGIGPAPPQTVFNHNVSINQNVFQGAAERGVERIVFASTLQLIGSHVDDRTVTVAPKPPLFPLSGSTTPDPSNVYALSKTVSEVMLRYYAERCGVHGIALRFPLLHHDEDRYFVRAGAETSIDVFEGFTGLTYTDAADLFLAVVDRELTGYRVFMAGAAHRHLDHTVAELIERFYPDTPSDTDDLIDLTEVTASTGWTPSPRPTKDHDS